MSPLPHFVGRKTVSFVRGVLLAGLCGIATLRGADAMPQTPPPDEDGAIPQSVKDEHFEELLTNSPFTRSLGVFDSIILTGIARTENDVLATLLDTKTMESHVVSKTANFQGWQLVGIGGNPAESRTWSAKIQIAGGEVISVRYQQPPKKTVLAKSGGGGSSGSSGGNSPPLSSAQLSEAKNAAVNYKEGFNADGYPRQPPPEMVAKLSRLSVSQREDINKQMFGLRNQGLGLDERRKIYENLVDRSGQGRR
ncbi:MAG: hypothetical protein Q8M07_23145 [Prosthecobacter sp.]|nr:hypothetical protein [Prosthecobacter sp.]